MGMFQWLFLLLLINKVIGFQWVKYSSSMDSYVYLGSTPYQNETFKSSNISNALRIQRDIATNVTIDQLIWPAVSGLDKENVSIALTMGYKRLVVDLYWTNNSNWQLETCALDEFLGSVHEYLVSTDLNTAPTRTDLVFLILNLHDNTTTNATVQDTSQLGQLVQNTFSSRLYTPFNLTADRTNVSASFYAQGSYFPVKSTASAWPNWLYLIEKRIQILVGYGTLPSNASFQLSTNTIFRAEDIGGYMNSAQTSCPVNQSWAFVNDSKTPFTFDSARQLVSPTLLK